MSSAAFRDFGVSVAHFESPDGKSRPDIVARHDGTFSFHEECEVVDDETEWGLGIRTYWTESHRSGLYDDFDLASADAHRVITWLRR